MSKEISDAQKPESDVSASGLLLSVDPISEGTPISMAPLNVDDNTAGDTDTTDGTDTDTTDDADGTDGGNDTADGDGTDGTDGDGTDTAG